MLLLIYFHNFEMNKKHPEAYLIFNCKLITFLL